MARAASGSRRSKKKTGAVRVNFKGVETRSLPPEGDYLYKVTEGEQNESGNGNDQIALIAEQTQGEFKGHKGYLYFPLSENSLWKLAAFMTAVGMEVPQDEVDVDPADFIDKEFVGVIGHDTYNGRKQAKIMDFDSVENYTGELAGDEKKGKKKKKDKDAGKDKADDKSSKKDKKDKGKSKDEPETKSSKKDKDKSSKSDKGGKDKSAKDDAKGGKKDKGKKKSKVEPIFESDDINGLSEKKLGKIIKEHELDVDLSDYKTDRKKAGAVIDALEAKGLMKD
jgi:hypothetical protein